VVKKTLSGITLELVSYCDGNKLKEETLTDLVDALDDLLIATNEIQREILRRIKDKAISEDFEKVF